MDMRRQSGMSLIELMIALTIGLVLMAGLTAVFVNSSKSQRVGQDQAQQNDNARYAMDTLASDLHMAGYFGDYEPLDGTGSLPDPCSTTPAIADMGFPVQGYTAVQTSNGIPTVYPTVPSTCSTWLPQTNLWPGSDVLVIRHVDGTPLAVGATAVSNQLYLQTDPTTVLPQFQIGNGSAMTNATKADGTTATLQVYNSATSSNVAGPVNQYYVNIYFVAPCSVPAGGGSVCTGSSDDNGHPIPTLKLLQLSLKSDGTAMTFNITTVAEGIEAMKLEYGVDDFPTTVSATGYIGDGQSDCFEPNSLTSQPAATDFPSTVAMKIFLISRSTTTVTGFKDTKLYQMSSPSSFGTCALTTAATGNNLYYGPYNDAYMRHGYESEVRLINVSGRREVPP